MEHIVTIAVALIGLTGTVAGAVIAASSATRKARRDMVAEVAKQQAETRTDFEQFKVEIKAELARHSEVSDTKIDHLRSEVEKHNGVVERMFKVETDVGNLFHRYEEIKGVADSASTTAKHAAERADAAHNRLDRSGIDRA